MLSVQECKQFVQAENVSDEQVEQIRNQLYLLAALLIEQHQANRGKHHDDRKAN